MDNELTEKSCVKPAVPPPPLPPPPQFGEAGKGGMEGTTREERIEIGGCAGILEQSMGAIEPSGIRVAVLAARLHRLAESIPWNRFLGSLKV